MADSNINNLIEQYEQTGRTATRYPRKKEISVDGRTMPEEEAVEKMRYVVQHHQLTIWQRIEKGRPFYIAVDGVPKTLVQQGDKMNSATQALYDDFEANRSTCPIRDICPGICDRCPHDPKSESPAPLPSHPELDRAAAAAECEVCYRPMNPVEAMMGKVCGDCTRAAHQKVVK